MPAEREADVLWNIDQLAEYLNIPKRTLYRWRTLNYGPQGIRVGRHVRYRRSAVLEWLDEMERSEDQ